MKITLAVPETIKGKDYEAGDTAIVTKALGERLIEEGIADRIIDAPENRMTSTKVQYVGHKKIFTGHRRRYRGSDGRQYVKYGPDEYVEVKD